MRAMMRTAGRLAAVVAVLAAAPAVPANADDGGLALDTVDAYYTYRPSMTVETHFFLGLRTASGARDVRLTVDARDAKGVVDLRADKKCHETDRSYVFFCVYDTLPRGRTEVWGLKIKKARGAVEGETATLRYSAAAAGGATAQATTRLMVGGPHLAARRKAGIDRVAAGSIVDYTPAVANLGKQPSRGVGVTVSAYPGLDPDRRFSNCRYPSAKSSSPEVGQEFYCWFDTVVEAGRAYEFSAPLSFGVSRTLMQGKIGTAPWASGQASPWADDPDKKSRFTERGSGPEVTLRPLSGAGLGDYEDIATDTDVRTTTQADLQAIGASIEGRTGQRVTVDLGARNAGPGDMNTEGYENTEGLSYRITPPDGTRVVHEPTPEEEEEDPWECNPRQSGARSYTCPIGENFGPGDTETLPVEFCIESPVRGAEGKVEIIGDRQFLSRDGKTGNNSAPLRVSVKGAGNGDGTDSKAAAACGARSDGDDVAADSAGGGADRSTSGGEGGSAAPFLVGVAALGAVAWGAVIFRRRRAKR
ncbi:hypothetical protein [Streptomyces sp. NPDC051776]|uniref:hypothetical protein n=1 Tax=Streptomyces sp. NPDC051776 TaxID=3155414 RepID=UPI00341ECF24